jgi:hypothetical protein
MSLSLFFPLLSHTLLSLHKHSRGTVIDGSCGFVGGKSRRSRFWLGRQPVSLIFYLVYIESRTEQTAAGETVQLSLYLRCTCNNKIKFKKKFEKKRKKKRKKSAHMTRTATQWLWIQLGDIIDSGHTRHSSCAS